MRTFFLFLYLLPVWNFAQTHDSTSHQNECKLFVNTVYDDVLNVAYSPCRMSKEDIFSLTIIAAATTACITSLDAQVDNNFAKVKDNSGDHVMIYVGKKLARIGYAYNDISPGYFLGGLTATMLVGGFVCKDHKLLETSRLMIESLVISQVFTSFGKAFFNRSRPFTDNGPHDFNYFKFSNNNKFLSMPSGHTSSIFAAMTVIAKQYNYWYVKIPAYTLGVSVALQRIDHRQHWTSDVIVGGALGFWVGSALVNGNKKHSQKISLTPSVSPYRIGIAFNF